MGEVRRYRLHSEMTDDPAGHYVDHDDYATLEAERDALAAELKQADADYQDAITLAQMNKDRLDAARAEVAKLRAACAMKETALIVYRTTVENALNDKNLGHDIWLLLQGISGAITTRTSKWYNDALTDDAGKNYVDASGAVESHCHTYGSDDPISMATAVRCTVPDDWAGRTVLVMVKP